MATIKQIKELRDLTGISITECQKAIKEAGDDIEKAKEILKEWGKEVAQKKAERTAGQGIVDTYIHSGNKIGVMIALRCESDFVAKSEEFKNLAHEICLQIAAGLPEETPLLSQLWIKDQTKTVKDLIGEYVAKIGENIILEKFVRYAL